MLPQASRKAESAVPLPLLPGIPRSMHRSQSCWPLRPPARPPRREIIISVFIPVGPLAMAAVALLQLRAAIQHAHSVEGGAMGGAGLQDQPPPGNQHGAAGLESAAVAAALGLWAAALWWLVAVALLVLSELRRLPFNLGWRVNTSLGITFPGLPSRPAACSEAELSEGRAGQRAPTWSPQDHCLGCGRLSSAESL